jgi:hypothetical protein
MSATLSVDDMYSIEKDVLNKNQNGYFAPDVFNRLNNQAQFDYMNFLLGDFRKYQLGRPIPPTAWGMTARIRESLTPFILEPTTLAVNNTTGKVVLPSDYEMWDAMWWGSNMARVKFIQQGRLYSHLNTSINQIATNPVFLSIKDNLTVYPFNIGSVKLSYIRTPGEIKWAYTLDSNGRPIYDSANSSDPEWQRFDCIQIMVRALRIMGVNLSANQVSQYAEVIKNNGQ